jgi:hypothetical protein
MIYPTKMIPYHLGLGNPPGLGNWIDDVVGAGQTLVDETSKTIDQKILELKATLGTIALLSAIGAGTGLYLVLRR